MSIGGWGTRLVWSVVATVVALVGLASVAFADPDGTDSGVPPAVVAAPGRPMPADPGRVNPIGGARISSTTPQGQTEGLEPPLLAQAERGEATVPMWAKDGIFAPTVHPNRQVIIHLPGELGLEPADWTGAGGIYRGPGVEYSVSRLVGGGVDIAATHTTAPPQSQVVFGIKTPPNTHLRATGSAVVVEFDAAPGRSAAVIGTFTAPVAHDKNGQPVALTTSTGPGFPTGQTNLIATYPDGVAWPATLSLSYRASDLPTAGAPAAGWEGLPPGAANPAAPVSPASAECPGGTGEYRAADGRAADFTAGCGVHQQCLATTPGETSVQACHNRLLGHLSAQCVTVFGQTGDDYEGCTRAAEQIVTVAKTTTTGPTG